MTRGFVRRRLIGLGLIAAGVLLIVLAYRPEMPPGVRLAIAGAFAAGVFGGLSFLFAGRRGLVCGAVGGVGVAMMYANRALAQPLGGLVAVAGLLIAIGSPMAFDAPERLRAIFAGRKRGGGGKRRPISVASRGQAARSEETSPLLLRRGLWIYQYLREDDRIFVARVLSITDENSEKPLLRSGADYVPGKGSRILKVSEILDVQRRMEPDGGGEYIRIRRRDGGYMPWCELVSGQGAEADAQLARVFKGIPVEWKAGRPPESAFSQGTERRCTGGGRARRRSAGMSGCAGLCWRPASSASFCGCLWSLITGCSARRI